MKNPLKTYLLTGLSSLSIIVVVILLQVTAEKSLSKCSYLDPITIDILAFCGGLFLIVEGLFSIHKNENNKVVTQLTRITRVTLGVAIVTIHIIQFIHK